MLLNPVAGWTRTTGWTVSIGSRRTGFPAALAPSAWATALWRAVRPSRYFWKPGLSDEYKAYLFFVLMRVSKMMGCVCVKYIYPELQSVSPPYSGPVRIFKDVVLGGWIS